MSLFAVLLHSVCVCVCVCVSVCMSVRVFVLNQLSLPVGKLCPSSQSSKPDVAATWSYDSLMRTNNLLNSLSLCLSLSLPLCLSRIIPSKKHGGRNKKMQPDEGAITSRKFRQLITSESEEQRRSWTSVSSR